MGAEALVRVRPPLPGSRDLHFIEQSWVRSFCPHRPARVTRDQYGRVLTCRQGDAQEWMAGHGDAVRRILARPGAHIWIAAPRAATGVIASWLVWEPGLVWFFYSAADFRRRGIAAFLWAKLASERPRMALSCWVPLLERLPLPGGWLVDETAAWAV
jgi:hypothetical protein